MALRTTTSFPDYLRNVKRTATKHITERCGCHPIPRRFCPSLCSLPIRKENRHFTSNLRGIPKEKVCRGMARQSTRSNERSDQDSWNVPPQSCAISNWTLFFQFLDCAYTALFFSLSFSASESSFVYTAEAKAPESSETLTEKFRFAPHFGEGLMGQKRPTLYVFRWKIPRYYDEAELSGSEDEEGASQVTPMVVALKPSLPGGSSFVFGQASFTPDQRDIIATGFDETADGRRLGAIGGWNRPSFIFKLELPNEFPEGSEEISVNVQRPSPPGLSARSPRVTNPPSGEPYLIVWLGHPVGGIHYSCISLQYSVEMRRNPRCSSAKSPTRPQLSMGSGPLLGYMWNNLLLSHYFPRLLIEMESHLVTYLVRRSRQTVFETSLPSGAVENWISHPGHSWTVVGQMMKSVF